MDEQFITPFLIFQAVSGPGDCFQPGGLNLASTQSASSISTVFDALQGVLDGFERLRHEGAFFEGLRCALRGGGVIGGISDLGFASDGFLTLKSGETMEVSIADKTNAC